jgi:hypothetical protein
MIAFHFPPFAGSSGVQRTLRFVQQLPQVRVAADRADRPPPRLREDEPGPAEGHSLGSVVVERAFALDTARHLSIGGRYPGALARPDRWKSWSLGAIPAGLRLIREHRPAAIWSTYPIATAHRDRGPAASAVRACHGSPTFRDPMAQEGYPEDPRTWAAFERIERSAVAKAACSIFTTRGAAGMYRSRYPEARRADPRHRERLRRGELQRHRRRRSADSRARRRCCTAA